MSVFEIIKICTGTVIFLFSGVLYAGIDTFLYEEKFGECDITAHHDAVPGQNGTLILRSRSSNEHSCDITEQQANQVLDKALTEFENRENLAVITSVFLGRIILYRWLSDHLVDNTINNSGWNQDSGRPVTGSSNEYVNNLLYRNRIFINMAAILEKYNYEFTGISCEKVLINEDKLPYDAMCWLVIK